MTQTGTIKDQKKAGDIKDDLTMVFHHVIVVESKKKVGVAPLLQFRAFLLSISPNFGI